VIEAKGQTMSETKLTAGWPGPKGQCDLCRTRKATHWFGDTSVALCDDGGCEERNAANWQRMLDDVEAEDA
jgi:hypothetical protein